MAATPRRRMHTTSSGFRRHTARPLQAALASAASFSVGATMPLLMVHRSRPPQFLIPATS